MNARGSAAATVGSPLVVGLDVAPPIPMQQGRPEDGDFRGYEVDLLEVAGRLGVRPGPGARAELGVAASTWCAARLP